MQGDPPQTYRSRPHLLKITLNICLSSFYFGYSNGYFNSIPFDGIVQIYSLQHYSKPQMQGFLTGCLSITGALGAYLSSFLLQRCSRLQSVYFLAYFYVATGLLLQFPHIAFLIMGRILQGICIGMCSAVVPLYLREFSPVQAAGSLCPFHQIFIVIGLTLSFAFSFIISLVLPLWIYWRLEFGLPLVMAGLQIYILKNHYPYETPKYLILQGEDQKAKELLQIIYKSEYVDQVYRQLKEAHDMVREPEPEIELMRVGGPSVPLVPKSPPSNNSMAMLISLHLSIQQQMVGMGCIIAYSGQVVGQVLPQARSLFPIFINLFALAGCFGAIPVVSYLGRKATLEQGALIISILLGLLSYSLIGVESSATSALHVGWIMLLFISIRVVFSLSLGPIVWLYIVEILQPNFVPIATMVNWITVGVVNTLYPILCETMGGPAYPFLIFSVYTLAGFLVNRAVLVETAGKTEVQIRKELDEKFK